MTFKSKIDGGYTGAFCVFTFVSGVLVYQCIVSFSIKVFIIAAAFVAAQLLLLLPMYLKTRYTLQDDGLLIQVGWFRNYKILYSDIFAYQLTRQEAKANYGLSEQRIVLYMRDRNQKNDVITISPKDQKGFVEAYEAKTGMAVRPPDPTFREIQDEYNKKTSTEQRKLARKRLWNALAKGYEKDLIQPESPETLDEKIAKQQKSSEEAPKDQKES